MYGGLDQKFVTDCNIERLSQLSTEKDEIAKTVTDARWRKASTVTLAAMAKTGRFMFKADFTSASLLSNYYLETNLW